jgi:hypothetical protein
MHYKLRSKVVFITAINECMVRSWQYIVSKIVIYV